MDNLAGLIPLSEENFNFLVARTNLGPRAREMARQVLLEGLTATEAGRSHGVSRQAAERAAKRVIKEARVIAGLPSNWVAGTWILPPELSTLIKALAKREYSRQGLLVEFSHEIPRLTRHQVEDIGEILKDWREL